VLDYSILEVVEGSRSYGYVGDVRVNFSQNFYPRYADHDPVFCMSFADKNRCVVQLGQTYMAPVLRHWGEDNAGTECNW
jgi:hypothetical protein